MPRAQWSGGRGGVLGSRTLEEGREEEGGEAQAGGWRRARMCGSGAEGAGSRTTPAWPGETAWR